MKKFHMEETTDPEILDAQKAIWEIIHRLQTERWRLSDEDRAIAEKHFWELTS